MKPKGRRTAIVTGAAALIIFLAAGFLTRDRLVEEWYILKLDSADFTENFRAALKLGEMRSTRAIPKLVTLLKRSDRHDFEAMEAWPIPWDFDSGYLMAHVFEGIGRPAAPYLIQALQEDNHGKTHDWRGYACLILGDRKAKEAVPVIIDVLRDRDWPVRWNACWSLEMMGPDAGEAIPALVAASKDPKTKLPAEAALEAIRTPTEENKKDG